MMTMQPSSHNNENRKSLQASSPLRNIKETRASGTRKETREQGAEKESESSLARSLATRNGEVAQSKHFLVVMRVRCSVSQFTLGIGSLQVAIHVVQNRRAGEQKSHWYKTNKRHT